MASNNNKKAEPQIVQWLLDTRNLWPASRALALLSSSEQEAVLRYYQVKDAKMSLASHLLKHLVITKYCNVPWSKSKISRQPTHGKPCYIPEGDDHMHIDFNVSHQAGIVSLIAAIGFENHVDVGTDVVCANERLVHDCSNIDKEGFFAWVDIHSDVFADSEVNDMKLSPVSTRSVGILDGEIEGYAKDTLSRCQWRNRKLDIKVMTGGGVPEVVELSSNVVIEAKLRRFYAMWCLRETYVKMTGEALLASWLKDLEISNVQIPAAKESADPFSLEVGDIAQDFKMIFKGKPVKDVNMELSALGSAYMVGGCVRPLAVMGKWLELNLETDVLDIAEANP
ncbi:4'-phosphopantetheinyl transferase [Lachnellula hyalina]|uniref:holo-[acyl-carrier-protein] synthase n=1 Tax=Lachnellula hyalina TaxID=1316788 RepID=A0A8H8QVX6_9HELO|nr:4'-phosphopantetheinyl transferase [Lachnellula hyalina]TVY23803.1 4'-phosphopantetheinyl transferase [Lachnellula hyalina]